MKRLAIAVAILFALAWGAWVLARSRTIQLFGEIVPRVETERKVVALTFDDGPRDEIAGEVLSKLAAEGVKATFFVCGAEIRDNPAATRRIVAAGHQLGNHSWSHKRMVLKTPSFIRSEFEKTDAVIQAAGAPWPKFVRAPYCKKLVGVPWYFAKTDRIHVTFDVEPETYPEIDRDSGKIVEHVLAKTRPGSIILLHPWYGGRERTRAAIVPIIRGLKAQGYEFVTVEELVKLRR